ncbi:MAG: sodium/solute symporter [Lentisphaeria bacterium]|nr:sodium/solute symporter [Lentisphaeria bacterium]
MAEPAQASLHFLDWTMLVLYLVGTLALGVRFYRSQKTTKDFFLAGRSMSWLPVGLSVVATLFSAISYIGIPAANQKYGIVYMMGAVAVFLCIPVVSRVFMPFYHSMQVYSAYEYLEKRFDVRVRCLASGLFILWRIVWMSTAVYAPSLALWAATGGQIPLIPTIILLGLLATAYTMLGGMKAVIWTDVVQFCVLFGGMVLAIGFIIARIDGGIAAIWQNAVQEGKTNLFPGGFGFFYSNDRVTLVGVIVASFVGHVGFYTVDQVTVQRYFTARSLQDARRSFWLNSFANVSLHVGLAFLGLALLAYFATHSAPESINGTPFKDDWRYPYFAATALPAGVAGIILAALYAATMSSVDSGINSCTTAFMVDFWRRLKYGDVSVNAIAESEEQSRRDLVTARILTVVLGALVTVVACFVGQLGSIIVIAGKLVNGFCGPMFVIFLMGMFTRRATPLGVCIGAVLSMLVMWYYTFFAQVTVNFLWTSTLGFVVALLLCYGFSLLTGFLEPATAEQLDWTFTAQRRKWRVEGGLEAERRKSFWPGMVCLTAAGMAKVFGTVLAEGFAQSARRSGSFPGAGQGLDQAAGIAGAATVAMLVFGVIGVLLLIDTAVSRARGKSPDN